MGDVNDILNGATWLDRVRFLISEVKKSSYLDRNLHEHERVFQLGLSMLSVITGGNISFRLLNRVREKGVNNARQVIHAHVPSKAPLPTSAAGKLSSPSSLSSISDNEDICSTFGFSPGRYVDPKKSRSLVKSDGSDFGSTIIVGGTKEYLDRTFQQSRRPRLFSI